MLQTILHFEDKVKHALELGTHITDVIEGTVELCERIGRMKYIHEDQVDTAYGEIREVIDAVIRQVVQDGGDA